MSEEDGLKQYEADLGSPNANFTTSGKKIHVENGETSSKELSKTRVHSAIFLISDNLDQKSTLGSVRAVDIGLALIDYCRFRSQYLRTSRRLQKLSFFTFSFSTRTAGERELAGHFKWNEMSRRITQCTLSTQYRAAIRCAALLTFSASFAVFFSALHFRTVTSTLVHAKVSIVARNHINGCTYWRHKIPFLLYWSTLRRT